MPNFHGLERELFQFVPQTFEHPPLHPSDHPFASLMAKIGQKIEKTVFFLTSFKLFPQLLASPPISFGIKMD